jgi:hypothetical protein
MKACFALRDLAENAVRLSVLPGGSAFPGHGFDVGAVQRGRRPEAVEHDANGAAIATRANDDPFPAGKIRASHRPECSHPDTGLWRQRRPFCGRSRRTESHCTHLFGCRYKMFRAGCVVKNPPARYATRKQMPVVPARRNHRAHSFPARCLPAGQIPAPRATPRPSVLHWSAGPRRGASRATSGPMERLPVGSLPIPPR